MGFSSIDLRTIKLGKEIDTFSISLSVNVLDAISWVIYLVYVGLFFSFFFF